jgi:hypothetical protein
MRSRGGGQPRVYRGLLYPASGSRGGGVMKRKILFFVTIAMISTFLTSCMPLGWNPPNEQDGTIWVSDNPKAYIEVDFSFNPDWQNNGGKIFIGEHGEYVEISIQFDPGGVEVYDPFKFVRRRGQGLDVNDAILFTGGCKIRKNRFTITVTVTFVDYIAVGDVITFTRVDELPEWAVVSEVEEEGDGDEE